MTALIATPARRALWLFVGLCAVYSANGRESGSTDSQAAKYLARDIVLHHTLTLEATVAAQPLLGERAAFARDREGRWRPAYGVVPGLVAAVPATLLHASGAIDMAAPRAPNLIAALTATILTAAAVTLVFLALRRSGHENAALLTALALGLGTNYWATVSQTLWQHESVAFGLALALWSWWRRPSPSLLYLILGGCGLAFAGAARMQVAPMILVWLGGIAATAGWRRALVPAGIVAGVGLVEIARNLVWFGHVLGASTATESLHPLLHDLPGPLASEPWWNALGLLISPSKGLLLYSPIVLVAVFALGLVRRTADWSSVRWLVAAAGVQFILYSWYAVWWAGHTFGPRYLMDVLIPLTPLGAAGACWILQRRVARWVAAGALAWSIAVSAMGAFVYPNERWNTWPVDVDRHHDRLWEWRDSQISRALRSRPSPQNFNLFNRSAVRRTQG